jgi:hypothetical protein
MHVNCDVMYTANAAMFRVVSWGLWFDFRTGYVESELS